MWVKIDDHLDQHPKIASISNDALALFVCGLAYSNRNLTDGFIPSMVGLGQLRYCDGNTVPPIRELEGIGLWEPCEGGWQIHDYDDYQPSRDTVIKERESGKERAARSYAKRQSPSSPEELPKSDRSFAVSSPDPESRVPSPESRNPKTRNQEIGATPRASRQRTHFEPPTDEEAEAEFERRGFGGRRLGVKFVAHYAAAAWKLKGGNPMKDWKAAVVTWCETQKERSNGSGAKTSTEEFVAKFFAEKEGKAK